MGDEIRYLFFADGFYQRTACRNFFDMGQHGWRQIELLRGGRRIRGQEIGLGGIEHNGIGRCNWCWGGHRPLRRGAQDKACQTFFHQRQALGQALFGFVLALFQA